MRKPRDAEFEPEPHDPADLVADRGVRRVEVGLEVVEAVEVVRARDLVAVHVVFCTPGKTIPLFGVLRLLRRTRCTSRGRAMSGSRARRLEPGVLIGRVVDDEVDDHAHAALPAWCMNSTKSPSVPKRGSTP